MDKSRVQIDSEVLDRADGCDSISINAEWYGRTWYMRRLDARAPHHFSLCGVQLQAIALHPSRYVVNTGARWRQYFEECLNRHHGKSHTPVCHLHRDGHRGRVNEPIE